MPTPIRLVTFGKSLPLLGAIHGGFLEREGLDVSWQRTRGSIEQVRGLLAGASDVIHTAADNVMAYRDRENADIVLFFVGDLRIEQELIVRATVGSYDDLRGTVLGVDALDTGYAIVLRKMLALNGLLEGADYRLEPIGGTQQRLEALRSAAITGCMLQRPSASEVGEGHLRVLDEARRYFPRYPGSTAATTRRWAAEHEEALSAYVRALTRGSDWASAPENRDVVAALLADELGIDPADAAERARASGVVPGVEEAEEALRVARRLRDEIVGGRPADAGDDLSSYWDPRYQAAALAAV